MKRGMALVAFIVCLALAVQAGGWNNTLIGTRALALGAFIAVADDPSAIFYNPAGLVRQESPFYLSFDGFYVQPTHELTLPTGSTIRSQYNSTIPQFFLTARLNDRITFGFGVFVPYAGGGVDWKSADLGFPLKTTMAVTSFTPAVAYKLSDKLSIGATLNYYSSSFTLNTDMAPLGPLTSDESGSALSAGFSLMYRPVERLAIGLSIRGPAKLTMSGKTKVNLGGYDVFLPSDTTIKIPWDIQAGFAYRVSERLLLSFSAQYTLWSTLDKVEKDIKNIPTVGDIQFEQVMDFRNIVILGAGMEYALTPALSVRAGVGLDKWAAPAESLTPSNIDVDKVTLLAGIGYRTGRMRIDFAYVYGIGESRSKQSSVLGIPLTETYNLNVRVVGLGLTYCF
jgi:long-chain fatty acid transport protein